MLKVQYLLQTFTLALLFLVINLLNIMCINLSGINTRIEDKHFWESQQLGDASPGVLLFTLVYILYKNFHLKVIIHKYYFFNKL